MKCPNCGYDNRENVKFCEECGTRIPSLCPNCGSQTRAGAKFCGECGARLAEAESATTEAAPTLEDVHAQSKDWIPAELARKYMSAEEQTTGENRPITALFADISGFTPLSNTQSSETMFQLVQECFRELVGIVARYEGSISGFRGDGLLALFGAPILHENDVERAILAAMDMRNVMQDKGLQVSIGINTAMMTVGEIQTQLHREYTAYGTDVNLAKRLQEAAEPGQILVGTGTHRLTRRIFDFSVVSDLSVKGFTGSVKAYSIQQVKERPEKLRGIEGLRARMIGREHEFADLRDAADVWLGGQGQMVSIIGEAGIGKSRLVQELKKCLEEEKAGEPESQKAGVLVMEGRCVSIGQPISYWPFLDILRSWFGLSEDDTEAERAQKVRGHIQELLPDRIDDILPYLGHLMNLRFGGEADTVLEHYSPERIQHGTMIRIREILVALSRRQPLLLILEDLHWADDLSLDLVSVLMDELIFHTIMLLCVYRPEQNHRVWRLGSQAQRKCLERYTEIQLQKLPPAFSRRLVQELLDIDELTENVREIILTKSEGNPFFIEEVIRSLIERGLVYREDDRWKAKEGIAHISVPDTIQSVVLARVDRLAAEAKHVLQCASVIGRLFKHRLLEYLTQKQQELDSYITEFEERDLVYEERTIPELEYAFKHALTQEATYQGIMEQRRKVFHREVAQGIERLYQERIQDFYEELAYHWERSGDAEKTLEYLIKAGKKAAGSYLNDAAIDYYTRAIELAQKLSIPADKLAEICEMRGWSYSNMNFHEESISDMIRAGELYTEPPDRANVHQRAAIIYYWEMESPDEAVFYARKTVEDINLEDKSYKTAKACYGAANVLMAYEPREADQLLREGIAISQEMDYRDLMVIQYTFMAWSYANYFPASPEFRERRNFARKRAISLLPYLKSNLPDYASVCATLGYGGDVHERIRFRREAIEASLRSGYIWAAVPAAYELGNDYMELDDVENAIWAYEQGWQLGVKARHIFSTFLDLIIMRLMNLYESKGEESKIHDMLMQMIESTLVLHSKPEVHPIVQYRWNDKVKKTYNLVFEVAPNVGQELQNSLRSRLNESDSNGQRFFYHCQLASLYMSANNQKAAEDEVQNLIRLRPHAGISATRIPKAIQCLMELMSSPRDRNQAVIKELSESTKLFEDLDEVVDVALKTLPKESVAEVMDPDHFADLALDYIRRHPKRPGRRIYRTLVEIMRLYTRFGNPEDLRRFTEEVRRSSADSLQEDGVTQLILGLAKPIPMPITEFVDDFRQDPTSTCWLWTDPKRDCSYEVNDEGYLQIDVPPMHDLWPLNSLEAPRLTRSISGAFIMETKISSGTGGERFGGLFIWKNEQSFARFEMASAGSVWYGGCVYYGANIAGKFIRPGIHPFQADEVWLRLERKGDRFTGYVSSDGENWYRCGWTDIPMEDPIQVGIHALCPRSPATSTRFEYFRIYRPE